jgi:hypothetical protein
VNRKRLRARLDKEIETLEKVIQLYRETIYRDDDVTPERADMPVSYRHGSKRGRIHKAIRDLLTRDGTCHRSKIADYLQQLGLVNGSNSPGYVSSILSASNGMFVTDHRGNWSLPTELKEPAL